MTTSNKTLRANVVVIASVPRKYLVFLTVVATVLFALGFGIYQRSSSVESLRIADHRFSVEFARTDAERTRGLSGRSSLGAQQSMIFVSSEAYQQCFWMKDMQFPIDMVWLDSQKRITAIESNVDPSSYPKSYCHEGQYVVELATGTATKYGFKTGDLATF